MSDRAAHKYEMRVNELLIENYSEGFVSQEFEQSLDSRGYKLIGIGDKRFYKSPKSNRILVVTSPAADKEFLDWVNFCNSNNTDPHLPKYTKLSTLNFQNPVTGDQEKYVTVFTEELRENRRGIAIEAIEAWGSYVERNPNVTFSKSFEAFLKNKAEKDEADFDEVLDDLYDHIGGGYQAAGTLFNSVKKVVLAGQKLGYENDLLDDNIMINRAGVLVLNDPWANI